MEGGEEENSAVQCFGMTDFAAGEEDLGNSRLGLGLGSGGFQGWRGSWKGEGGNQVKFFQGLMMVVLQGCWATGDEVCKRCQPPNPATLVGDRLPNLLTGAIYAFLL